MYFYLSNGSCFGDCSRTAIRRLWLLVSWHRHFVNFNGNRGFCCRSHFARGASVTIYRHVSVGMQRKHTLINEIWCINIFYTRCPFEKPVGVGLTYKFGNWSTLDIVLFSNIWGTMATENQCSSQLKFRNLNYFRHVAVLQEWKTI